jgi:two-component system alkaline phosphatase synthesis response regulator PhoP
MPKKILLIDDDDCILKTTKRILEQKGYLVSTASDGEAGLQIALFETPDLVILDLGLPKLPGEEVCRGIKITERTKNMPVIMLTGKISDTDKIIGKVIGADYYMTKPFNISELLKNIAAVLKE